ncbi:MAG: SAM-dependent methyltransferase, partial [Oscillospiraceae bacterium]
MAGKLFVVGTPIGNLSDFSPRALKTLKECDFIAAEDTRVTLKLLNRFEIKKPMVSYY